MEHPPRTYACNSRAPFGYPSSTVSSMRYVPAGPASHADALSIEEVSPERGRRRATQLMEQSLRLIL